MLLLDAPMESLRAERVHRFARLWEVQRLDGVTRRFTDHPYTLEHGGQTFAPASGGDASARQAQEGLKSQNMEMRGFLDADAITQEDLEANRYDNAMIVEYLVDWRYPWGGYFDRRVYWIQSTSYSDIGFTAQLVGVEDWLRSEVGGSISRNCPNDLGDEHCRVDVAAITVSGTVTAVHATKSRHVFETDLVAADDNFNFGWLSWTAGNNANTGLYNPVADNLGFQVRDFAASDGEVTLFLFAPFTIQVGDTFDVYPGCDQLYSTCQTKFVDPDTGMLDNTANFRGFRHMPGLDRQTETPEAKQG